jgi:ssDNA-binding Zn-finger/Zn-ribbon topoisomerase 1
VAEGEALPAIKCPSCGAFVPLKDCVDMSDDWVAYFTCPDCETTAPLPTATD